MADDLTQTNGRPLEMRAASALPTSATEPETRSTVVPTRRRPSSTCWLTEVVSAMTLTVFALEASFGLKPKHALKANMKSWASSKFASVEGCPDGPKRM